MNHAKISPANTLKLFRVHFHRAGACLRGLGLNAKRLKMASAGDAVVMWETRVWE
jgi:hypothetical protein